MLKNVLQRVPSANVILLKRIGARDEGTIFNEMFNRSSYNYLCPCYKKPFKGFSKI
jgi:hypothetical protein